jgi:hypothetical protein
MNRFTKYLMLFFFYIPATQAQLIVPNDVIINEILFNPAKDGFDFIEGYNRSAAIINLNDLMIANRNGADEIASLKNITREPVIVRPGNYFVLTVNENWLRRHYYVPDSALIIEMSSLPALPDEDGCLLFLTKRDTMIVDELRYSEKWHFKMIGDPEGIALERINHNLASQDRNNWISASSSSGYGTPGYINSQFIPEQKPSEVISVLPKVISPGNDGSNDYAFINISVSGQGKIANAVIYDANGRKVRYLLKNELLGAVNRFMWDGCDDRARILPSGIYIILTQIFDLHGTVKKYRNCVVLNSFPP